MPFLNKFKSTLNVFLIFSFFFLPTLLFAKSDSSTKVGCKENVKLGQGADQGEILLQNNKAKQLVLDCQSYTVKSDGKILTTLNDDDVTVVLKRKEDGKNVIIAKSNGKFPIGNCTGVTSAINQSEANTSTGKVNASCNPCPSGDKGCRNDAIFFDRNGKKIAYYQHTCGAGAIVPDEAHDTSTISQRVVSVKAGDIIYMSSKSDRTPANRVPNTVRVYEDTYQLECKTDLDCCVEGEVCIDHKCVLQKNDCKDGKDNDDDGLIDKQDLGCQGDCNVPYYCGNSTTDKSISDGNEQARQVPFTTVYNVTNDGEVTLEMKNDDVAFVLKRVEDGKANIIGMCGAWVDEKGSDVAPLPINHKVALQLVSKGGNNSAVVFDRDGTLQFQMPDDGSRTCPQAARSDTTAGKTTITKRTVKVKKGDKIYINTKHEKNQTVREHNYLSFKKICQNNQCSEIQNYKSLETDNGKDFEIKGTTSYIKGSKSVNATDYCKDAKTLIEYYATNNPKFNSSMKPLSGHGMMIHTCDLSCLDGACTAKCKNDSECPSGGKCINGNCVKKSECEDGIDNDGDGLIDSIDPGCQNCKGSSCIENQKYISRDTDGGKEYYKKGSVSYRKGSTSLPNAVDYCKDAKTLVEFYSTNKPKFNGSMKPISGHGMEVHTCVSSCLDGACDAKCKNDADCQKGEKCEKGICVKHNDIYECVKNGNTVTRKVNGIIVETKTDKCDGIGIIKNDCSKDNKSILSKIIDCAYGCDKDKLTCNKGECKDNFDCKDPKKPICNPKTSICEPCPKGTYYDEKLHSCTNIKCEQLEGDRVRYTKDGKSKIYEPKCAEENVYAFPTCDHRNNMIWDSKACPNGCDKEANQCRPCGKNQYIFHGVCVDCIEDSQCKKGQSCVNNKCQTVQTCEDLGAGKVRVTHDGESKILEPSCKGGELVAYKCDEGVALEVYINCPGGCDEKTNICKKNECITDADCKKGMVCNDGKCEENTQVDNLPIVPILNCVVKNVDGTYSAYFGYENNNPEAVTIAAGTNTKEQKNVINGDEEFTYHINEFKAGKVNGAFYVPFNKGQTVAWTVKNSTEEKTVEATSSSKKCKNVEPKVQCIDKNKDGSYTAHFGYLNKNEFDLEFPAGTKLNEVIPAPSDRGQPEVYIQGKLDNQFAAKFTDSVTWILNGVKVIADKNVELCNDGCTENRIDKVKAALSGDEILTMLKNQANLLKKEIAKDDQSLVKTVDNKVKNGTTLNEQIKSQLAKLPDVLMNCEEAKNICVSVDNKELLDTVGKKLKSMKSQVNYLIKLRKITSEQSEVLVNELKTIYNKIDNQRNEITRMFDDCSKPSDGK